MALKPYTVPNPAPVQVILREPRPERVRLAPAPSVTAWRKLFTARSFFHQTLLFVLIGVLLYASVYAVVERMVSDYTVRNRFFIVKTAPLPHYDYVILGASRAVVLDYEDMNSQLEAMTSANILNLSTLGGGITVNRLLLDYFLVKHETEHVVYFLDSFVFYSPEWNEERVTDVSLYRRAPFDPALLRLLLERPYTRPVVLGYLLGFYKINNPDWFALDISEEEATRFDRTYRPVPQIDRQRMAYLYPDEIDPQIFRRYLADFEDMLRYLNAQNIGVTIVKPPLPEHIYTMLPQEEAFDLALQEVLQRYPAVEFYDFSLVGNEREFFFNSDHLNRTGVFNFSEQYLKDVLEDQ
jgi:hypothetical protein